MEDHVHLGKGGGGVVHLLPVDGEVMTGQLFGLVVGFEEQRSRSTGRVVDGLAAAGGSAKPDDLRHDAGDFSRRVELAFAFAGVLGKVPHQVFVGIAQQVVSIGSIGSKV